jgi:hypothetical protein
MDDVGLLPGLILFLLFAVLGVIAIQATSSPNQREFEVKLFVLAIGVRFLCSIVIYQFGLVSIIKDEDAGGWYVGKAWHQEWLQNGVSYLDLPAMFFQSYSEHHKGYYYLVAILFYVTDMPFRLSAAAMNCLIGALTVIVCYRTGKALFSDHVANQIGWWTCLYPSLVMWSAQTLKEPVVILLESLVIYGCVSMRQQGRIVGNLVLIVSAIMLLIPFRFYAAYIAAATVFLSFLGGTSAKHKSSSTSYAYFVVTSLTCLVLAFLLLGRERETELFQQYSLEGLERYRNDMAADTGSGSGSTVKITSDLQSTTGLAVSVAVGGAYLLFAPFPWQLATGSMRMLLVSPEVMLWWWLLIAGVVPGMRYAIRNRFRDVLPLLVMVLGLGLLYSLTFANIGLVYRQRAQLLPWLIMFAVIGRAGLQGRSSMAERHVEPT